MFTSLTGNPVCAEVTVESINMLANTIQIVALAYIAARFSTRNRE